MITRVDPSMSEAVGPCWSLAHAADRLGTTEEHLQTLAQLGRALILCTSDGRRVVPLAWLDTEGLHPNEVLMPLVALAARHDPWAVAVLLNAPMEELGGLAPAEWARRGLPANALARLAKVVDGEWR